MRLPDLVPADIEGALLDLGISGRVRGNEMTALCPNPQHADSSPSWSINVDTGKHHCFSCGFGGSFQWLVQITKGVRAAEASAWIKMQKVRVAFADEPVIEKAAPVTETDLWPFHSPPEDALRERDISLISCMFTETLFDYTKNEWIFVLRDPFNDRVIGWQSKGRGENSSVVNNYPPKMKKASTVFGYRRLKATGDSGPVIVVENPVKVMKFMEYGFPRVVATCGASFTDYQVNELLWPVADEVIFALDNDMAAFRRLSKFLVENPYARDSVSVFNYGNMQKISGAYVHFADDRDPGDLTGPEIVYGVEHRTPGAFTYFEGVDWYTSSN